MRTFSRRRWLAGCAALLTAAALPALADGDPQSPPGGSVPWQQLSPEQQRVLGQFRGRWDRMPPQQQEALLRGAQTQGLFAASIAETFTRCQPGVRVAESPQREPSGSEVHAEQTTQAMSNICERTATSFSGIAVALPAGDGRPV